ncbi:SIS domain-containing protein [Deinococcus sp. Marseille-Q6407]|uniref:SIS domain-containing protein n=1 Tax=Deinococcus sp. Marseille-Q6407 TaxID=2969223 RepID=UPI0021BEA7CC|nr:SIS domain-containing protein [Deinococcus sp. Marseille-Q6407]
MSLHSLLLALPGSYSGPVQLQSGPYGVVGTGEGTLAALLAEPLIAASLSTSGTQFVLSSPDSAPLALEYTALAEAAGAQVRRVATGGDAEHIDTLIPAGVTAAYHGAQYLAYASGHADEAQEADRLLATLAQSCAGEETESNPARELAWRLHGRTPLLLADEGAEGLVLAWQHLLARTGKSYSVPVLGDPLPVLSGMFEAQHEQGDGKVGLLLGDLSPRLDLGREIMESRVDEVIHLPFPDHNTDSDYAPGLALWYLGAWTALYLAEIGGQSPEDSPVLRRAQAELSGESAEE